MTERRETGRGQPQRKPKRPPRQAQEISSPSKSQWSEGDRIAKYLAHAGICSRREAETLIAEGKVMVNGERLDSPAVKVFSRDQIKVRGKLVKPPEVTRMWLYHKPAGLITATRDPEGRPTIFDHLPKTLPRVVTVGRLDLTTEGLLILTNDGELARNMELPATGLERHYRARAHGRVTEEGLKELAKGAIVDGVEYSPIQAVLERTTGTNNWLSVVLKEGKNREVRKALASIGLTVNRLIRIQYGPFSLGDLPSGQLQEVPIDQILKQLGTDMKTDRMSRSRHSDRPDTGARGRPDKSRGQKPAEKKKTFINEDDKRRTPGKSGSRKSSKTPRR